MKIKQLTGFGIAAVAAAGFAVASPAMATWVGVTSTASAPAAMDTD